jgi:3-oxoacyl-[acyl-carrier-protein] synthase-1
LSVTAVYVRALGMACPVGLRWAAACAAMRAGIHRKQELPYLGDDGKPIVGSFLRELDADWTSEQRWLHLLGLALKEVGPQLGRDASSRVPILAALPPDAGGRPLREERLAPALSPSLGVVIDPRRLGIITEGAPGGYSAIAGARDIARRGDHQACIVAAADSLFSARALLALAEHRRLLTEENSDGVIPGEAAACLAVSADRRDAMTAIRGLGFASEPATLHNDVPSRAAAGSLRSTPT